MGAEHERDPRVHFLNDPTAVSGSRDRDVTNARDSSRVQGGNNYHLKYTRLFGDLLVEGSYSRHNGEVSDFAALPGSRNSIVFRDTDARTLEDEQLGGFGLDDLDQRDTDGYKATAVVQAGRHDLHGGFELMRNSNFRDTVFDGGLYTSLAGSLAGLTAAELFAGSFSDTRFDPTSSSDHSGFVRTVDQLPDRADFYSRYDLDGDGVISQEELASGLTFASTAGNPHGAINYDRMFQSALGAQQTRSNGMSLFLQDTFSATDRLSFNLGLRAERFAHFATDGANIFTFDWTLAPRLSVSYDPAGNGRQRISAFYGKYYDPIRNNLTNFAGTLTGSIREEQVYANDQWVTYRTRGGPQQADALFAPTTKTPWTDDFQVSCESDLGGGRSVMALYTKRRTRDIIEDYDMALYTFRTDGTTNYPGPGRRSAGLDRRRHGEHLFKVSTSYHWDPGFQIGANWRWNSGTLASRTFRAFNRNLPGRVETAEEFEFAGFPYRWLSPTSVGTLRNPSYGIVDVRLLYNYRLAGYRVELFADVFNLLDNQDAIRNQDLLAGAGGNAFGDGIRFTPPRRVFIGARLNFG